MTNDKDNNNYAPQLIQLLKQNNQLLKQIIKNQYEQQNLEFGKKFKAKQDAIINKTKRILEGRDTDD